MAINNDIEFIIGSKIILVRSPVISVTNQDIFDSANNFLDEVNPNRVPNFVFAGGLEVTSAGQVGLTLTIVDWKIQFEDRVGPGLTECTVTGTTVGRIGTIFGATQNVIEPSDFVFARIQESVAGVAYPGVDAALIASINVQMKLVTDLLEADQVFDKAGGLLHYYFKGTTVDIVTPKTVSGEQVTNDVSLAE